MTLPGDLVRAPGVANSKLSDGESVELLNWLVMLMGPAAPAPPYTADEVNGSGRSGFRRPQQRGKICFQN